MQYTSSQETAQVSRVTKETSFSTTNALRKLHQSIYLQKNDAIIENTHFCENKVHFVDALLRKTLLWNTAGPMCITV